MLFATCVLLLVGSSYGSPVGAPTIACEDMTPGHGPDPQTSPAPYSVSVVAEDDYQLVTATADEGVTFRGFFIQARLTAGGTDPQGYFEANPSEEGARFIDCAGITDSAATHVINSNKTSVSVRWYATDVDVADVTFMTTFVQVFDTFWVGVTATAA